MKAIKLSICAIAGTLVVLLGLIYFLPGYDLRIVRSDSMKPLFSAGDMVVTVPPLSFLGGDLRAGAVVSYKLGSETITHRIVSADADTLITKGDANEEADPRPVQISQVEGIYVLKVPRVGYFSTFIHTRTGWLLAVVLPGVLLLGLIVKDIIKEALKDGKPKVTACADQPLKPSDRE